MTASTTTHSRPMASLFMTGASIARGMDQAAARGFVTLARRYER